MRIAHVTATFPPYYGGTGNVCYHNARELVRRGHEVHVFTAAVKDAPSFEIREGIQIYRLRPLLRLGNAPILPALLRLKQGFDIIHLHYPFFGGEITALAARLSHTPLVITHHQDVFLSGFTGVLEKILRHTLGRWTLRSARRGLFTSQDYGQASYIRPLLRGREATIRELPNGVDLDLFSPGDPPDYLRARYHLTSQDPAALLVASLDRAHYFKGVDVFLDVIAMLSGRVKGVIVGDGDMRQEYIRMACELGLEDQVIFAGRVSDQELTDYYRMADVTLLPSVSMGEAFGLVLVESLASGTPVIASDLPGVRTIVADHEDGLLAEPGNTADLAAKLARSLDWPSDKRRTMGASGRAKVAQRYAWEQIGERLEGIYRDVLAEPALLPDHNQAPLSGTLQD